jgi:glucosamine-6-phosphate deaminase
VREWRVEHLTVRVYDDVAALAAGAAADAATHVRDAITARGRANLMLATGTSQLVFLARLIAIAGPDSPDPIDWTRVTGFHMDEYVGIAADHPASFRRWIRANVEQPLGVGIVHYVEGDADDAEAEADRYSRLLAAEPIDLVCMGIGENGHIAFNEPGQADFDDPAAARVIALDERSRRQQVGEGHFATLTDVPETAITLTVPALLAPAAVLVCAPEARKAAAVTAALTGPITADCPASALRGHPDALLLLDGESAAGLPA